MSERVCTALIKLVNGDSTLAIDHQRCKNLLGDELRGESRKEVNALSEAIRSGAVEIIRSHVDLALPARLGRAASRLHDETGLDKNLARWAVESWALAIPIATAEEIISLADPMKAQQGQELTRLQQEGETRLTQFLHEVFTRTKGKPTKEDEVAVNDLRKRHNIPSVQAKQVVREFREQWQKAHPPAQEDPARAQDNLSKDESDRAIADATGVIRHNPNHAWAYVTLADAWLRDNDYDRAIADATEAIRLDPQLTWAYAIRGAARRQKGLFYGAITDFRQALLLDPTYEWCKNQLELALCKQR